MPSRCSGAPLIPRREKAARLDGHARLAHLPRGRQPALVDHRPQGADRAAQRRGQLLGQLEVVLLLDAPPHGHQDVLLRDVHVAGLGQDPLLEADGAARQRPAELALSTTALPACAVGRKLPGNTIKIAGVPDTSTSAIILPPQNDAVTSSPVAVGLHRFAAGHQRRRQAGRQASAPGPSRSTWPPISTARGCSAATTSCKAATNGSGAVGGQLRIVDQHDPVGRAQRRRRNGRPVRR